jgi:AbiV family abortive infection protein
VNQTATKIVKAPKISFRKLSALEYECYQNALDLHFDSILLAKARSFASAFAISVIASEEFGKGFGFAELSFQAGFSKRFNENDERFFMALLSDHKLKQGWFVSELFGVFGPKSVLKRYRTIQVDQEQRAVCRGSKRKPSNRTSVLDLCIEGKRTDTNCPRGTHRFRRSKAARQRFRHRDVRPSFSSSSTSQQTKTGRQKPALAANVNMIPIA